MKMQIVSSILLLASSGAFAAPQVSNVTLSQADNRQVIVSYRLTGEPAVVTVDIQTNGVSIGAEHLTTFAGDVNRLVQPDDSQNKTMTWRPLKNWPEGKTERLSDDVTAVVTAWSTNAPPNYMVVSLVAPGEVAYYAEAGAIPGGVTNDLYKTEYLVLRKCPAANVRWRMGSPSGELGRKDREVPHVVTLKDDFYIGIYPITQRQFKCMKFEGKDYNWNPSYYQVDGDLRPVEYVMWTEARGGTWPVAEGNADHTQVGAGSFADLLRKHTGIPSFDLPTDAQGEFAGRAGVGTALYSGDELDNTTTSGRVDPLGRYANNGGRPGGVNPGTSSGADHATSRVGEYAPNDWGLYDMVGNVFEWCLDWYQDDVTGSSAETGPASNLGSGRVCRGGCWQEPASYLRSAFRSSGPVDGRYNTIGFRMVCGAVVSK